ncbi:hypothetical protein ABIF25_003182 [Bradyrhizobium elkanii]
MNRFFRAVMAGLVPAIHVFSSRGNEDVDARDKPGHDEFVGTPIASNGHMRLPYPPGEGVAESDCREFGSRHAVSHTNPLPFRLILPIDGEGKCAGQHSVSVSQ